LILSMDPFEFARVPCAAIGRFAFDSPLPPTIPVLRYSVRRENSFSGVFSSSFLFEGTDLPGKLCGPREDSGAALGTPLVCPIYSLSSFPPYPSRIASPIVSFSRASYGTSFSSSCFLNGVDGTPCHPSVFFTAFFNNPL